MHDGAAPTGHGGAHRDAHARAARRIAYLVQAKAQDDARSRPRSPPVRLDDAARAGWLYYVAGNTRTRSPRQAWHLTADRAAAGLAGGVEGLIKGLSTTRSPIASTSQALRTASPRPGRGGAKRSRILAHQRLAEAAPPRSSAGCDSKADRHGDRHRPYAEGRDRATAADGCPQHKVVSLTGNISPTARPPTTTSSSPWPTGSRRAPSRCRCRSSRPRRRSARCCSASR